MSENKEVQKVENEEEKKNLTKEEQDILKLQKKIEELKNRKQKKEQKLKNEMRKKRNHRLIQVGVMVEKIFNKEGEDDIRAEIDKLFELKNELNKLGVENVEQLRKKFEIQNKKPFVPNQERRMNRE